jgi:hypothetical protein
MISARAQRLILILILGSLASAACGVARYSWIPGVMRGITWTCADSSSAIARQLRTLIAAEIARPRGRANTSGSNTSMSTPMTDSTRVITAAAICQHAGRAYASETRQRLGRGTYQTAVIATRDRYVVRSVTAPAIPGEWNMILVFDSRFHPLNEILGFSPASRPSA